MAKACSLFICGNFKYLPPLTLGLFYMIKMKKKKCNPCLQNYKVTSNFPPSRNRKAISRVSEKMEKKCWISLLDKQKKGRKEILIFCGIILFQNGRLSSKIQLNTSYSLQLTVYRVLCTFNWEACVPSAMDKLEPLGLWISVLT